MGIFFEIYSSPRYNFLRMSNTNPSKLRERQTAPLPGLSETIPTNLTAQRKRLIGRHREIAALRSLLLRDDINLVSITGSGGAGKTTLATSVASSVMESFPSGVFFIDLEPLNDASQILPAIFQTLKLREESNHSLQETLNDFFSRRAILLVLDNFEHLMGGAKLAGELLETHTLLKMLVTSREPLRLRHEQVFPLEPLSNDDAVELFTQRARALNPNFSPVGENAEAVSRICHQLDGLPLAIELAAQRISIFTPQSLLARLQSSDAGTVAPLKAEPTVLDFLTSKTRDLPTRHQALGNTIAWSYGLLNEYEQHVLRVASMFQGGFSLRALEKTIGGDEASLLEAIASLVDKNLLKTVETPLSESRFSMLNTIREFAWAQMLQHENIHALREKYLDYYHGLARDAELGFRSKEQVYWLDTIDVENANLQVALGWGMAAEFGSEIWNKGIDILAHLQRYWLLRGHFATGAQWQERARAIIDAQFNMLGDEDAPIFLLEQRGRVYGLSGYLHWIMGRYHGAKKLLQISLDIFQSLGDESKLWEAMNSVAVNLEYMGEFEQSREYYRRALYITQKIGDRWQEMRLLINTGNACIGLGDFDEGQTHLQSALTLARELGDDYYVAACFQGIGYLEFRQKRFARAESSLRQSLALFEKMDVPFIYVWTVVSLARVLAESDRHAETSALLIQSIQLAEFQKDRNLYRTMLETFVAFCISLRKWEEAAQFLGCMEESFSGENDVIAPVDQVIFQNLIKHVQEMITAVAFVKAKRIGAEMDVQHAFDLAVSICNETLTGKPLTPPIDDPLTMREREVLILLAKGRSNAEISQELVVVEKTVEKHVANILRKLAVKNRTEAAAWAVEHGIK